MAEKILDRNAYTIGWICALSVESAAAQAFLDERHQVPSDVSDSNSYVTGRIGKHNVVVAVMPQNEYGTTTAATTAKDMVRSFPQVRLGLMVGIGGGAPSQEHDIRLGDVVVSSRGKGIGGVIQFDYGKSIQNQDFKETGHLNQPPPALMTAVAALDAQYDLEGPRLYEKVEGALKSQRKAFKKKYAKFEEAAVLIDALDECEENNDQREILIQWILKIGSMSSLKHVKIITTARPEAAFKKWLDPKLADANFVELDKEAIKADIGSYIKGCLMRRPGFHAQAPDHPVVKQIPGRLIQKADGMFRYAACQIDDIVSCFGPEEIEDVLDALPETIQETYRRSIEKIPPKHKLKALRLLQFIVNLDKPLELAAAVDIVSVRSDFRTFSATDRICPQDIVRLCPNLLSIVEAQSNTHSRRYTQPQQAELHLAHLSVKEYLIQSDGPEFTLYGLYAGVSIVRTCLSYLLAIPSRSELREARFGNWGTRTLLRKGFPFNEVAELMLKRHAVAVEGSPETVNTMADQLQNGVKECSFGSAQWRQGTAVSFGIDEHASCLHFACYLGLLETTKILATRGVDINYQPENSLSPIGVAVRMNWVEIVQFLLDFGVSPNTTHNESLGGSIFRYSCRSSRYEILRLLARKGADLNKLEGDGESKESPLQFAVTQGNVKLVHLLLDEGANVNANCGYFGTALQAAAQLGVHEIVAMLLEHGADVNAVGGAYGHALQAATRFCYINIVKTLLDGGADVNAKGGTSSHALQTAVERGHEGVVELLLQRGADVNAPSDTADGNAIDAAFRLYHESIIAMLLDRGAEVNTESSAYRHALEAAAQRGNESMVRALLEKEADSGTRSDVCGPALNAAVQNGHQYVVGLLLEKGVDPVAEGNVCGSALMVAVKNNHEDIVRLLLERGANADNQGEIYDPYHSAFQVSAKKGCGDLVKIFLDKGADAGNRNLENTLYVAAARGNQDLIKILLESGAGINTQGGSLEDALHSAVAGGHQGLVEVLLQKGAGGTTQASILEDALHTAVARGHRGLIEILLQRRVGTNASRSQLENSLAMACLREFPEVMRYLLDYGADANASIPGTGNILYNTLSVFIGRHGSWSSKRTMVLRILLEAGAKIQPSTSLSYNSLRLAVESEVLEPVKLLLSHRADPNILFDASQAHLNHSLLMESLVRSQPEIAQELLRFGADPSTKTSRRLPNQTALHLAMDEDFEEVVRLLLQKGADPNESSGFPPFTPLQLSVKKGAVKYTRLFLEHGADVEALGGYRNNLTAVNLAERAGNVEVLRLLAQATTEKKNNGKRKHAETVDSTTESSGTEKLQRRVG